ncbi:MAG: hypothetical protein JWO98_4860 [Frankiales bacterium]|nr:hypothetical protein [Frankiales bacterium]
MRTATRTSARTSPPPLSVTLPVRLAGAASLLAAGGIHLYLWQTGYRDISVIGPLFMANAVLAGLAALAVLATPARWLPWIALLAGLLQIGTLGGLLLTLTVGLFNFVESWSAPLVVPTIIVEAGGFLLLCGFAAQQLLAARQRGPGVRG